MPKLDSEFHLLSDNLLVFKITLYSLLYILGLEITKMKPLNHLIVVLGTFIRSGKGRRKKGGQFWWGGKLGWVSRKLLALVRLTQVPLGNVLETQL